jgi:hypothetical protein
VFRWGRGRAAGKETCVAVKEEEEEEEKGREPSQATAGRGEPGWAWGSPSLSRGASESLPPPGKSHRWPRGARRAGCQDPASSAGLVAKGLHLGAGGRGAPGRGCRVGHSLPVWGLRWRWRRRRRRRQRRRRRRRQQRVGVENGAGAAARASPRGAAEGLRLASLTHRAPLARALYTHEVSGAGRPFGREEPGALPQGPLVRGGWQAGGQAGRRRLRTPPPRILGLGGRARAAALRRLGGREASVERPGAGLLRVARAGTAVGAAARSFVSRPPPPPPPPPPGPPRAGPPCRSSSVFTRISFFFFSPPFLFSVSENWKLKLPKT